ncbi:hypothetical protein GVX81_07975 [[Haemophilus] felis]|uniref:Uncharacterized protein n=1 Tax=[Haemophilus] felis TaxID=123822 RepID=A0A1T0B9V1_9PAST|nr:hypothetical protein [[Haemophilus] felis]OOS06551.1 hypothetical protein B0188_02150 [[Haemophilus] felis]
MNKEKSIKLDVNDKDLAVKVLYARELGYNVEFSMSDYFKYTAAKNINITSFRIFSRFFSGVDTEGNKIDFSSYKGKEISYADMVDLIYKYPTHPKENNNIKTGYEFTALYEEYTKKKSLYDKAMKGELVLSHYKTNSNDDRYAANALIFGSASLEIEHKNVKFYIDKNGIPSEIQNFSFIALDDNYDYKSNKIPTILNKIVQYALRDSSSATTKIRFIDDRGDNRFITINRTEFDWLKHHTSN